MDQFLLGTTMKLRILLLAVLLLLLFYLLYVTISWKNPYAHYRNEHLGVEFTYLKSWGSVKEQYIFQDVEMMVILNFTKRPEAHFIAQSIGYFFPDDLGIYYHREYPINQAGSRSLYTPPQEFCFNLESQILVTKRTVITVGCILDTPFSVIINDRSDKKYDDQINHNSEINDAIDQSYFFSKQYYFDLQSKILPTLTLKYVLHEPTKEINADAYNKFEASEINQELGRISQSIRTFPPIDQNDWYKTTVRKQLKEPVDIIIPTNLYGFYETLLPNKQLLADRIFQFETTGYNHIDNDTTIPVTLDNSILRDETCDMDYIGKPRVLPQIIVPSIKLDSIVSVSMVGSGAIKPMVIFTMTGTTTHNNIPPLENWSCPSNNGAIVYYFRPDRIIVNFGTSFDSSKRIILWDGISWRDLSSFVPVHNPLTLGPVNRSQFVIEETSACCDIFYPTIPDHWSNFAIDIDSLHIIDVYFRNW